MKLPRHLILSIDHNEHKSNYDTVENYIKYDELDHEDFVSEESMKRAIETDEMWRCQWYPDTPIGFCKIHAATLEELLEYLANTE